jgi:hypothetical protein
VNAVQIVWLAIGATGTVGLFAITFGLLRQVKRLGRAVSEFGRDIRPTLDDLQREAARAQTRSEQVARRGQELQDTRDLRKRRSRR